MLTLESLRKLDTLNTENLTDEELECVRNSFYELGQLMFEDWHDQKIGSKSPIGSLTEVDNKSTI